jgi:hypothetical protein
MHRLLIINRSLIRTLSLEWGRSTRANHFHSSFECRVSGGRKHTILKQASILVARGNSSGDRKKNSASSCRGFHRHGLVLPVGGMHSVNVRESMNVRAVSPFSGVDAHQRVLVIVGWSSVVLVLSTRSSVEVGCWVAYYCLICWRGNEGESIDMGG